MPGGCKRNKGSSWGLLNNYRYLCKKSMMLNATDNTRAKKCPQKMVNMKRKRTDSHFESQCTNNFKKTKSCGQIPESQNNTNSDNLSSDAAKHELFVPNHNTLVTAMRDRWEVDSGFSSEGSPPASGRSSPCLSSCPTMVVALDCEMVGTGQGGHCSELARCSIVDYHGHILYDKYIKPCQPVTDYRTPWSGIRRHHLFKATPFNHARSEIMTILEGRVIVGHSVYNDFQALDIQPPYHMVRDTGTTRLLTRLAGFPRERCASLKILAKNLLKRTIQVGKRGHCSVEDARTALDLYKLVEGEWEQELQNKLRDEDAPHLPAFASSNHYMQDEYWPSDVTANDLSATQYC